MEREAIVEAVVALVSAVVFVAALIVVGLKYGGDGLSETGGWALIGVIALFIVLMSGVGYWLSRSSA